MKIDIGNGYFLCGDSECVYLTKTTTTEDGKKYDRRYSGYYRTYEQLFANFVECHFRKAEVKDTVDILRQIQVADAEVKEMAARLGKELDKKVKR